VSRAVCDLGHGARKPLGARGGQRFRRTQRGRYAATKPARRTARYFGQRTQFVTSTVWCFATSAGKQVFHHREAGRTTEDHREGQNGASRGAQCNTARSATLGFSVVLSGSPCFSVVKDLLAFGIGPHDRWSTCLDWPTQAAMHLARHLR